jgi:hypothetical protein
MTRRLDVRKLAAISTLLALFAPSMAWAGDLADFIEQGRFLFDARARYENVQQSGFARDADAGTVRERLGYETAPYSGLKLLAELQATQHLSKEFNDTINGRTAYPQVPDPESFALNRLQLSYAGVPGIAATVGRQVINLDDQRFIGASAFRQNEQTFDAARLDYTAIPGLTATYAYVDRVNRVFSERNPAGHFNGNIHLLNVGYDIPQIGKLTAYSYLLDLDHNPALSTATQGFQLGGARPLGDALTIRYLAGYARQSAYARNPANYALDYWRLEGGIDYQAWSFLAGAETLGGNGTAGFSTPLATLHAYQGDADAFLTTPPQGVADRYAKLGYQTAFDVLGASRKLILAAWYHDFSAAYGTAALGHEVDVSATVRISEHWQFNTAHAAFDGTPGFASRDKTWISLMVTY